MARLAAIGTLIAALALPAVASAAAPAHHCKTGAAAVRLDGHRGCASLGTLRRAAGTAPPSAARIDADMARALLRHAGVHVPAGVQRIALLRLARAAAMVTERAHAAARSGGPLAGGGTGAFDSRDPPPGQVGEGAAVTVTTPVTIGGHVVDAPATYATQQFSQRCPGATGDVPGTVALRQSWTLPTPLPHRLRAVVDVSVDMVGTLTGHVGADGHLHDYDLVVDVVATVRGSVRGPAGLVHGGVVQTTLRTRVVFVGLSLDAMPAAVAFDARHIGSISLQTGGRRDLAEFRGDELFMPSAYLNAAVGGS